MTYHHDTSGAEHLLSRSDDLSLPMTIRELRFVLIPCPNNSCTKKRGEAVMRLTGGGVQAPCPTCRGAGMVADPGFDEKLDEVWAVLLFVKRERDQALVAVERLEAGIEHLINQLNEIGDTDV